MAIELLSILGIGFLLGLRHSFDPDHVVGVSTIASRTGNLLKAASSGIYWGIGHSLTLFIIGIIFISLKATIPETVALSLEMVVGIMLVVLGWTTIRSFQKKKVHVHVHQHDQEEEAHAHFHTHTETNQHKHQHISKPGLKSFWIGIIHGLAGSGALVVLTMSTMSTVSEAATYLVVFGLGTVLGMLLFTLLIGLPFVLLSNYSVNLQKRIGLAAGFFSIAYGLYFIYEIAFIEGLLLF